MTVSTRSARVIWSLSLWVGVALAMVATMFTVAPRGADAQAAPAIVINEFVASNQTGVTDHTGENEDWIELHNTSGSTVNLNGWTLSDGADTHTFAGLTMAGGEYLVIFASGDPARSIAGELHVDFKLGSSGESLVLANGAGTPSSPSWPGAYPAQQPDISYGRDNNGGLFFFDPPTPGAANAGGLTGFVEPVTFSVDHGFYQSAQSVVLNTTTPSATIRYTIDGSTPTATNGTALVPGTAIAISETTVLRAAATRSGWVTSPLETRSYLFAADIVQQSEATPAGWPNDLEINDMSASYGIDADLSPAERTALAASLTQLPTVSITTDLDNLFDANTGIWANSLDRGSEWERPASIELIDPTGAEPGFEINGGLRVKGNSSRRISNFKHSMRLVFNNEYGDGELNYPIHGADGVDAFESIDLKTSQSWSWNRIGARNFNHASNTTWLRDVISRDAQGAMGQLNTESKYVTVFLNGQYWGLYLFEERVSNQFASQYLGGNESDYDVINERRPAEARDGTIDDWRSLWPMVEDLSLDDAEWAQFQDEIDVVNLADFYLLMWLSGDTDNSPRHTFTTSNNWLAVRNRTRVGPGGKWQFVDKDSEATWCANFPDKNPTPPWNLAESLPGDATNSHFLAPAWLMESAITRPEFRQIFQDRVQLHMLTPGGALTIAESQARLDARLPAVDAVIDIESARWGDTWFEPAYNRSNWETAVQVVRDCFVSRTPLVEQFLREDGLWPLGDPPVISPAGGAVAAGTTVSLTADPGAAIWVTTDGTDPSGANGQPAPGAFLYAGPFPISETTVVTARVLDGADWSPTVTATFTVEIPARIILNEWNAVDSDKFLKDGGTDSALGTVVGNGGDWFELVVIEDMLDIRGWTLEISDADNDLGVQEVTDVFEFTSKFRLKDLRAGSIITVSEDFADNASYRPAEGDWTLNLQANSDDDGQFFTASSQSNFNVNNDDWQLTIRDKSGQIVFGPAGEGVGASGVGSDEIGELEADPTSAITPTAAYDDGDGSTFGEPNGFDGRLQDFAAIRPGIGDGIEPDTVIDSPLEDDVLTTTAVTIAGTATDNVGVASVRVAVKNRDTGLWLQADGSYAATQRFLDSTLASPGAGTTGWTLPVTLTQARWLAVARAEDTTGARDSTRPITSFEIQAPVVDSENPNGEIDTPLLQEVLDGPTVTLSGTATDDVAVKRVRVTIKNRDTGLTLQPDGTFANGFARVETVLSDPDTPSTDWTFTTDLPNGEYVLTVDVRDTSFNADLTRARVSTFTVDDGVKPDTTAPTTTITNPTEGSTRSGAGFTAVGVGRDDVGISAVRVSIQDTDTKLWLQPDGLMGRFTFINANIVAPGARTTTWTLPLTAPAGNYVITARAIDAAGNVDPIKARVTFVVN